MALKFYLIVVLIHIFLFINKVNIFCMLIDYIVFHQRENPIESIVCFSVVPFYHWFIL